MFAVCICGVCYIFEVDSGHDMHFISPSVRAALHVQGGFFDVMSIDFPWVQFLCFFLLHETRSGFPCLASKAAPSKVMTFWLAFEAEKFAMRDGATQHDRVVAACIFAYKRMLEIMSNGELILSPSEAQDFKTFALKHLQCYSWLHKVGMTREVAQRGRPGYKCWLLLPKLHHLWHLAHDTARSFVNPACSTLLTAESFIGILGRISRAAHRSTVSRRTLERYLLQVHSKLRDKFPGRA